MKNTDRGVILHEIINQKAIMVKLYPAMARQYGAWPLYIYGLQTKFNQQ